jgi:hypothetical protein
MRPRADAERVRAFARELGRLIERPARMYLTGGATAVLEGWRRTTVDIDISFDGDPDDVLQHIPVLKERLHVNVELVSPTDFIPEVPGWRDRSPFVMREGRLEVHHFDPYSQALSKLERAFDQDLEDVTDLIARGFVDPPRLLELFEAIEPMLFRYPAIDPPSFRARVEAESGRRDS